MSLFTDWKDCNQLVEAMVMFFDRNAQRRADVTLWYESTRELIESVDMTADTLGIWTTADVLFTCAQVSSRLPDAKRVVKDATATLLKIGNDRKRNYESRSVKPIHDGQWLDLNSLLKNRNNLEYLQASCNNALNFMGMPRNVSFSSSSEISADGPSHTVATAACLRALAKACQAGSSVPKGGEVKELMWYLADQLISICPAELIQDLEAMARNATNAETRLDAKYQPFVDLFPPNRGNAERTGALKVRGGFAHEIKEGVYAWSIEPSKQGAKPDPITTAFVLSALAEASNIFESDRATKVNNTVALSLNGYLLTSIIQFLSRAGGSSGSDPKSVVQTPEAIKKFAQTLDAEHLSYNDLSRLAISLAGVLDVIDSRGAGNCPLDKGHLVLHFLAAKLVEKVFVDLAIFQRLPYDRLATQFVSGSEVQQWPGIDVSFICPALLLASKHAKGLKLHDYCSFEGFSEFFKVPLDVCHPAVKLTFLFLESQVLAQSDIEKQKMYMRGRNSRPLDAQFLERFIGGMVWGGTRGDDLYAFEDIYFWETSYALWAFCLYWSMVEDHCNQLKADRLPTLPTTSIVLSSHWQDLVEARHQLTERRAELVEVANHVKAMQKYDWLFFSCALSLLPIGYFILLQHKDLSIWLQILDWVAIAALGIIAFSLWALVKQALNRTQRMLFVVILAILGFALLGSTLFYWRNYLDCSVPLGLILALLYPGYLWVLGDGDLWKARTTRDFVGVLWKKLKRVYKTIRSLVAG